MAWLSTDRQWRVLRDNARRMRKKPTPAEAKLWEALRAGKLGVNFRRQHGIGPWIVDFYAPAPKLIIEVDGGIHSVQELEDEERQGNLESADLHLLRFTNDDGLKNLDRVLLTIRAELKQLGNKRERKDQTIALPNLKSPSPVYGEGQTRRRRVRVGCGVAGTATPQRTQRNCKGIWCRGRS